MEKKTLLYLIALLLIALALRLSIISYGLPLWLINDEPSTVLGSLKMMELKSLIPAFHTEEMSSVLYYPPYISYLYIIPFGILFFFQYLTSGMDIEMFKIFTTSNLSDYFILARLISIVASLLSIFIIYKSCISIFESKKPALFATLFASTSLIHIALSSSARIWIFVSLIYSLAIYVISNKHLSAGKKYFLYYLVASIGMGVSSISILLFVIPPVWYIYVEKQPINDLFRLFKNKKFYLASILVIFLTLLPSILYPLSNGFIVDITSNSGKNILDAILSPFLFIKHITLSEPILISLAIIGIYFLLKNYSRISHIFVAFIYMYSVIFYFMFRFESRFTLPILPFIYILAGYGTYSLWQKNTTLKVILVILFTLQTAGAIKLAYIGHSNDSRVQAMEWAYENLNPEDKVITFGSQLRLPINKEVADELREIDVGALRKIDNSEEKLSVDTLRRFHSLNIYTIQNKEFFENIESYSRNKGYTFLILEKSNSEIGILVSKLAKENMVPIASFGDSTVPYSLATSEFAGGLFTLFSTNTIGPEIKIYRINQ